MKLKKSLLMTTSAFVLTGSMAFANAFSDRVIQNLQADGFTGIEVKNGLTQTKVEAVRGNRKIEVIYDRATGNILKQEWEAAETDDLRDGVEVQTRMRDFLDGDDLNDDDDDDDDDDRDDDDDDDDRDDDDDDDDDRDDDRDDDDDNDDHDDRDDDNDSDDDGDDSDDDGDDDSDDD
ncbi:MAG: PepSY domain-containing protein [Pseudomonadota bacterium]